MTAVTAGFTLDTVVVACIRVLYQCAVAISCFCFFGVELHRIECDVEMQYL